MPSELSFPVSSGACEQDPNAPHNNVWKLVRESSSVATCVASMNEYGHVGIYDEVQRHCAHFGAKLLMVKSWEKQEAMVGKKDFPIFKVTPAWQRLALKLLMQERVRLSRREPHKLITELGKTKSHLSRNNGLIKPGL